MSSPATTVKPTDSLGMAAEMMVKHDIGEVVVVEGNNPVGIITERDLTRQVVRGSELLRKAVGEVMSKPLVTAPPTMSAQQAFELMLKHRIRRLAILEGKSLIGMVTEKGLMRWVLRVSYEPNIPNHIKAILEAR